MKRRPGVKVVERGEGYKILRFSWWVPESMITEVLENVRKDAAIRGRELTITLGHRDARIEGDICAS